MVKTYAEDLAYCQRLVRSINEFNVEDLPVYIVAPAVDLPLFAEFASASVTLLSEDLFAEHLTNEPVLDIAPGYVNQEIIKIAFWELDLCENYVCVDSEAVFLRPFGRDDFMAAPGVPYTILSEDFELRVETEYFDKYWRSREAMIRRIQDAVGLEEPRLLTCHGHAVLSSRVLKSLKTDFMEPRGYSYLDLIGIAPYEFSWYNCWLQKTRPVPLIMREPVFKTIHSASQHLEVALRRATSNDLARGYVGVVVNSGFSRQEGVLSVDDPRYQLLGRFVPPSELARAASLRIYRRLPTLQRLVKMASGPIRALGR